MAKKYKFDIEKINDNGVLITNNNNLEYLIRGSYGIYENIMKQMRNLYQNQLVIQEDKNFTDLIANLLNNIKEIRLSIQELYILKEWIDWVCIEIINSDSADFKNEYMKKFLKLAEAFIKKVKELNIDYEPILKNQPPQQ